MRAIVDTDACIGCELCVDLCPEVFVLGDDSKAAVKADPVPSGVEQSASDAAEQCPVEAIEIEE